jgi:altronate hydrolase
MALVLSPGRDNVAVALRPLSSGTVVELEGGSVTLRESIRVGHKFALEDLPAGAPIFKYQEVIGRSSSRIEVGSHVHVHNVVSERLPGQAKEPISETEH